MNRFSPLLKRLRNLEPSPEEIEPWPPIEGSFLWAMLEGMKTEGVEIPEKPANEPGFMFLARLEAPRLWAEDCPSNWRWDPKFERQMEELAEKLHESELSQAKKE